MDNSESYLKSELKSKEDYIIELENTLDCYEETMKSDKNQIQLLESKLENEHILNMELKRNSFHVEEKEIENQSKIVTKLENELQSNDELSNVSAGGQNENCGRIKELEDALRESIEIATDRETVLQQEELKRKQIMEKVSNYSV